MEVPAVSLEEAKRTAGIEPRAIPANQIDSTFKSQYTGVCFAWFIARVQCRNELTLARSYLRTIGFARSLLQ
jgi:hypothetical protein